LTATIRQYLQRVTAGRYMEVTVDPQDLAVRVLESSRGEARDARYLSHGTSEQLYLLLRVALAEHLTKEGEVCPLLLDEVTVQSDALRTRAILEMLLELSADRQIILFTQEDDVRDWAEDHLVGDRNQTVYLEL
jgi:uncharacterized protein YhaN